MNKNDYQLLTSLEGNVTEIVESFIEQFEQSRVYYREDEKPKFTQLIYANLSTLESGKNQYDIFIHKLAASDLREKIRLIFNKLNIFEMDSDHVFRILDLNELIQHLDLKSKDEIQTNFLIISKAQLNNTVRVFANNIVDLPQIEVYDLLGISDLNRTKTLFMDHTSSLQTKSDPGFFEFAHLNDPSVKTILQEMLVEEQFILLYKPII